MALAPSRKALLRASAAIQVLDLFGADSATTPEEFDKAVREAKVSLVGAAIAYAVNKGIDWEPEL